MVGLHGTLEERFWRFVVKRDGNACWEWSGTLDSRGYGQIRAFGRNLLVHRVAWELMRGPIPNGSGYHRICVCHKCDNKKCVKPDHLFLGTHKDNMQDMIAKGRGNKSHGETHLRAKLTMAQVKYIRSSSRKRIELAREFGVSVPTIEAIIYRRNWKSSP